MSGLYFFAAGLLVNGQVPGAPQPIEPPVQPDSPPTISNTDPRSLEINPILSSTNAGIETTAPEFSHLAQAQDFTEGSAAPKADIQIAPDLSIMAEVAQSMAELAEETISNHPLPVPSPPSLFKPMQAQATPVSFTTSRSVDDASAVARVSPNTPNFTEFTRTTGPASGSQMYLQRVAALRSGRVFTRISPDSYRSAWSNGGSQPTYQQWKWLLAQEARAVARGQGNNRLSVLVGDSLSLWFPSRALPSKQFWLNQGISGDTSAGVLRRLQAFSQVQADTIYLMVGINDLRRGIGDGELLNNQRQILRQLRRQHPQAQIVVQSILPVGLPTISNERIRSLNRQLIVIARQEGAGYLDLYSLFVDNQGNLNWALTTDGLHLSPKGYQVWQWALNETDSRLVAMRRNRQAI